MKTTMKNIVIISGLLSFSAAANASSENPCEGKAAPSPFLHYPANIAADVMAGKISATVRKDIRCYKEGSILTLSDDKDQANYGKVQIEKVKFVTFKTISGEEVKRSGMASLQEVQNGLMTAYGKAVDGAPLTEIYFKTLK